MHSREPGDDAELTLRELRRLVHGIKTASYSVERSCKVTGAQLFVLRELSLEPGASIRRLSERTLTDPSSVSVIVARLVELVYVRGRSTKRTGAERRSGSRAEAQRSWRVRPNPIRPGSSACCES